VLGPFEALPYYIHTYTYIHSSDLLCAVIDYRDNTHDMQLCTQKYNCSCKYACYSVSSIPVCAEQSLSKLGNGGKNSQKLHRKPLANPMHSNRLVAETWQNLN
jgi:hypothetical protein